MTKSISIGLRKIFIGMFCFLISFSVGLSQPANPIEYKIDDGFKDPNSGRAKAFKPSISTPSTRKKHKSRTRNSLKKQQTTNSISDNLLNYFSTINKRSRPSSKVASNLNKALISTEQQQALLTLKQTTSNNKVIAYFDKKNGTPSFLQGSFAAIPPLAASKSKKRTKTDAKIIAKRFLNDNKFLLKLTDPDAEMRSTKVNVDKLGFQHVRFQQMYQGIAVFGKQAIVHINNEGQPYLLNGGYVPTINNVDISPSLLLEQAKNKVRNDLASNALTFTANELIIYADLTHPVLSYKLDVNKSLGERWIYFIDAHNGEIVHRIDAIHTAMVTASGNDDFGVNQSFTAWQDDIDDSYYMIDPSISLDDVAPDYDPITNYINTTGDAIVLDLQNKTNAKVGSSFFIESQTLNSNWDPIAVSALKNMEKVYLYFKNNFQRKSINDNNQNLISFIHYGNNVNNAFWTGTAMVYGDGDGQTIRSLARCLDVTAHEMSHGVIQSSAGLIYSNQSGALDESFADVFAAMIDGNWLLGEDCIIANPGYLRNLENPDDPKLSQPQPAQMSDYKNVSYDHGGVHINSGIPNRAAFLTDEGIGRSGTQNIYYRALTQYLTASSQFIDARRALIQATTDIYGADSPEVGYVTTVWDYIEVVEGEIKVAKGETSPNIIAPITGEDKMYYFSKDSDNTLKLYEQTMTVKGEYVSAQNKLLTNVAALQTRPAPYTDAEGTSIFFIDATNNIRIIDPAGKISEGFGDNEISSISISPDGRYFAYTSVFLDDNQIHIIDLDNDVTRDYTILQPNFQDDSSETFGQVRYADSLSFDYASQKLVFDTLVCLPQPNSTCDSENIDSGYNYWSVGILDLSLDDGRFIFPFPSQSPDIHLEYPTFANNNNFVIALDVADSTSTETVTTHTIDFEEQTINPIIQTDASSIPSFWGNDDFLTIQSPDSDKETIAVRIPINTKTWERDGDPSVINPFSVTNPIMHRAGQRKISTTLDVSSNNLDFGSIDVGSRQTLELVVTNNGNHDVDITGIDITSDSPVFQHIKGTNTNLPSGSQLTIVIDFAPTSINETFTGSLKITSNGTPDTMSVSLTGTAKQPATSAEIRKIETQVKETNRNYINYFKLAISEALSVDASVTYSTYDGTAKAGKDYISERNKIATIEAGKTEVFIPVYIIGDTIAEPDETFGLLITNPTGGIFPNNITEITATHTIIDDD